jgi:D-arabinose 1-dehydrogenase-like Zn-dependent alcohol dehydrogenase
VPGHEVAGVIDEVGAGVQDWQKGDRVGVGWHGGQDGTCPACRRGDFLNGANAQVCGVSYDGGYQECMVAPLAAFARMPATLAPAEAAPLLCAGLTTCNALRHSGAVPSDRVAVQGMGGLGHLGVQFAKKCGDRVAVVGRGTGNAALATAPSGQAMSALIGGLAVHGTLLVVGASDDPIAVRPRQLLFGRRRIQGWLAGIPTDAEDTLRFAAMTGVRPLIETYPLAQAAEGYARMRSGKAACRVVLTM